MTSRLVYNAVTTQISGHLRVNNSKENDEVTEEKSDENMAEIEIDSIIERLLSGCYTLIFSTSLGPLFKSISQSYKLRGLSRSGPDPFFKLKIHFTLVQ